MVAVHNFWIMSHYCCCWRWSTEVITKRRRMMTSGAVDDDKIQLNDEQWKWRGEREREWIFFSINQWTIHPFTFKETHPDSLLDFSQTRLTQKTHGSALFPIPADFSWHTAVTSGNHRCGSLLLLLAAHLKLTPAGHWIQPLATCPSYARIIMMMIFMKPVGTSLSITSLSFNVSNAKWYKSLKYWQEYIRQTRLRD